MKSESEIRAKIKEVTDSHAHVLCLGPASIQINAPRALMQLSAISRLEALYFVLGIKRPRFGYDKKKGD